MKDKRFFYNKVSCEYDKLIYPYDLETRLDILLNRFSNPLELKDKLVLDIGCGPGYFSIEAKRRGARVISADISINFLRYLLFNRSFLNKRFNLDNGKEKFLCVLIDGTEAAVKSNCFDIVIASEMIEHTSSPEDVLCEIYRILKPGGVLLLTVPNRIWIFTIWMAKVFNIRKFDGYENWVTWFWLKKNIIRCGFLIEFMIGFHLFPYIFKFTYPLLAFFDKYHYLYNPFMLNIALRAKKDG